MPSIDDYLRYLHDKGGSDLHLAAGLNPRIRLSGSLRAIANARGPLPDLDDATLRAMMRDITTDAQWRRYLERLEIDFAYGIEGLARYRVNFFHQHNGSAAVFRIIPEDIQPLSELGLPEAIGRFAHLNGGFVLITGPTGSGKSTTLAAIIDLINRTYRKHIVTIEDPIEFVHQNRKSIISQREIGAHSRSFSHALKGALRQNPDVVLVGELRDPETISLAVTAAEMGALVFATLHTNSAHKTVDRLIDAFPADEQQHARTSIAQTLVGVLAQLLLPKADGQGRVAAAEILLKTTALPNIIREGKTEQLISMIQSGKQLGMQTMDDALMALLQKGTILPQDAHLKALEKERFEVHLPPESM